MPTDRWYADRIEALAEQALRQNQERRYQLSWAEAIHIPNTAELQYMAAVPPSVIRRLIRRCRRYGVL